MPAKYLTSFMMVFLLLSGCMDSNARKGRPTVKNFAEIQSSTNYCTSFTEISRDVCYSACPDGYHEGTTSEIEAEIEAYVDAQDPSSTTVEETIRAELKLIVENASGICIETPLSRPTGEIYIKPNHCACDNGEAYSINDCSSFCSGKTDTTPTLHVSVTVGANILLNENLKTLKGWCENPLEDDGYAPSCVLQAFDGSSTQPLQMNFSGVNAFTSSVSSLSKNQTYVMYIEETQSGAKSQSFQMRFIEDSSDTGDNSPLKIMPISQYTCITRNKTGSGNYWGASRIHYIYPSNDIPPSLPQKSDLLYCHDTERYGSDDSPLYPRMELVPNAFSLWDKTDLRFYDTDPQDNILDINGIIQTRLAEEYNLSSKINIFQSFVYNYAPTSAVSACSSSSSGSSSSSSSCNAILQGFYMQPWIDENSKLGFCPKQSHYNGSTPIFRILKELVGVDTEGVYFARRQALSTTNPSDGSTFNFPTNVIIVRETDLKKVWFYYENGLHLVPTDTIAGQKTIMFYYPFNFDDPYTKKSTQYIYTIFNPTEESQNTGTPRPSLIPPNKLFGCVPAIDN